MIMMVDEHFKGLSIVEWRRDGSLVLSYVERINETN